MADLVEIAQSGVDPLSGSYLSAENRKAIFKRSRISSSGVFGGGAGSLVPISKAADPEALSIVKTNTSSIVALQSQVSDLVKKDAEIFSNLGRIVALESQVNVLEVKVIDLGTNLQQIANLIAGESVLERQKERLIQEQEKRSAEMGVRRGKESLLEKKIQDALMWPIKQIGNKVQFGFNTLMNFMWTLLGGWLTIQGLNVLKALSEGNKKKLEDIKNNVIKSLLIVGGTLSILSIGIFRVIGSITRLAFRLSRFVLSNTIGRLFGAVANLVRKSLGLGAKEAATAGAGASRVTMGAGTAEEVAKAEGKSGNWLSKLFGGGAKAEAKAGAEVAGEVAAKAGGRGLLGAFPIIGTTLDVLGAGSEAMKGNWAGAGLYSAAAVTSLIPGGQGASLGFSLSAIGQSAFYDGDKSKTPAKTATPTKPTAPPKRSLTPAKPATPTKPTAPAAPVASMSPPASNLQIGADSSANTGIDFSKSGDYGYSNILTNPSQESSTIPQSKVTAADTRKVPTVPFNIPQQSEPKPNIVYMSSGNQNQSPPQQSSLSSGSATDVPLIPSADSDNFYTLYAQVNYNVIM